MKTTKTNKRSAEKTKSRGSKISLLSDKEPDASMNEQAQTSARKQWETQNEAFSSCQDTFDTWYFMPDGFEKQNFFEEHYDELLPFTKHEGGSALEAARLYALANGLEQSADRWRESVSQISKKHQKGMAKIVKLGNPDATPETRLAFSMQAEENIHNGQLVKIGEREIARRADAAKKARREAFEMRCRIHAQVIKVEPEKDMLTIGEAAKYAGVNEKTIRNWLSATQSNGAPMLPEVTKVGRRILIPRKSLDLWRKEKGLPKPVKGKSP